MTTVQRRTVQYAQNFLTSRRLVAHLLDRADIGPADTVLEIGPGRGIITDALAQRCRRVVAVEKDPLLAVALRERFAATPNVTCHHGDILHFPLPRTPYRTPYKVFANIPFNSTAAIVGKLTLDRCPPDDAYLIVQREAAARFLGQPRETLAAILLKPWFAPSVVYQFQRGDFTPAPRVDVVMLRLRKRGPPRVAPADRQLFRDFAVYLFTAWQPSLGHALAAICGVKHTGARLREAGIAPNATPTLVPCERWLSLFTLCREHDRARLARTVSGAEQRLAAQQARLHKQRRTRVHSPRSAVL